MRPEILAANNAAGLERAAKLVEEYYGGNNGGFYVSKKINELKEPTI